MGGYQITKYGTETRWRCGPSNTNTISTVHAADQRGEMAIDITDEIFELTDVTSEMHIANRVPRMVWRYRDSSNMLLLRRSLTADGLSC